MKVAEGLTTIEEVLRSTPSLDCGPELGRDVRTPALRPTARPVSPYVETTPGGLRACLESAHDPFAEETHVKIKSQKDFWSGLMFVAVGAGLRLGRHQLQLRHLGAARARATSRSAWASCWRMLGAMVLFKALTIETEGGDPIGAIAWRPLILIIAGRWCCSAWRCRKLGMVIIAADADHDRQPGRRRVPAGRRCSSTSSC